MNHQDYVSRRSDLDPKFRQELALATAELQLATAIVERRMTRNIELGDLAERVGIVEDRLEAIEEGDQITIVEALRLAHELDLSIAIEPGFRLNAVSIARVARQLQQTSA